MQTSISKTYKNTTVGQEADAILRSCVHCGFCNATCPTYQLLGDELDGPRGRIYLIKQMLEGEEASRKTQLHLDRCLTCRACETTCPSGVQYHRLLDIGRELTEQQQLRSWRERVMRKLYNLVLPYPSRFAPMLSLLRKLHWLLPAHMKSHIPTRKTPATWPESQHQRQMIILEGCVQAVTHPDINHSAARLMDKLGVTMIRHQGAGCCGAVSYHLTALNDAKVQIRHNIDAWWPDIEKGAEAVVSTSSACSAMIKDYGHVLHDDQNYAKKAARISGLARDIVEVIADEHLAGLRITPTTKRVAVHSPCSLQHGQRLPDAIDRVLVKCGFELTTVADGHLCCGAAGTYSMLQPELSSTLLENKLAALVSESPQCIVTANIGCLIHMQGRSKVPVRHWVELLASSAAV